MGRPQKLAGVLSLAIAVCGLNGTAARSEPSAVREVCMSSVRLLCPKAVAGMDRKAVRECLVKNLGKATPACRDAIEALRAQHPHGAPD